MPDGRGGEVKEYNSLLQCYSKAEFFEAQSLFMVLILQQQWMINRLIQKLSNMNNPVEGKDY